MKIPRQGIDQLVGAFLKSAIDNSGRIRVEDAIHIAAAACGEACLLRGNHFAVEENNFKPWQPIISDDVNKFIGESADSKFVNVEEQSVFGFLYRALIPNGYVANDFPDLDSLYRRNIEAINSDKIPWGSIPLSVPEEHRPRNISIRTAYEARPIVDAICQNHHVDEVDRMFLCAAALAGILIMTKGSIEHRIALLLTCEIIVAVAKRVPMSKKIMAKHA